MNNCGKAQKKSFWIAPECLVVSISRQIDEEQENTPYSATLMYLRT